MEKILAKAIVTLKKIYKNWYGKDVKDDIPPMTVKVPVTETDSIPALFCGFVTRIEYIANLNGYWQAYYHNFNSDQFKTMMLIDPKENLIISRNFAIDDRGINNIKDFESHIIQ